MKVLELIAASENGYVPGPFDAVPSNPCKTAAHHIFSLVSRIAAVLHFQKRARDNVERNVNMTFGYKNFIHVSLPAECEKNTKKYIY